MTSGRADRTANPAGGGTDGPRPCPDCFLSPGAVRTHANYQVAHLPNGLVHQSGRWADGEKIPATIYDPRTGRTTPFDPAKHSPEPDPPTGGD